MKSQNILIPIFVLLVPFFALAQQQRSTPPEEVLQMRLGDLANFENYFFRFETAWEENELQSMEDIRVELLKIMEKEVAQLEKSGPKHETSKTKIARIALQKSLTATFKNHKLSAQPSPTRPVFLTELDQFRKEMVATIDEMTAELNANTRN